MTDTCASATTTEWAVTDSSGSWHEVYRDKATARSMAKGGGRIVVCREVTKWRWV